MCGRYTLEMHFEALVAELKQVSGELECVGELEPLPRYNQAPTDIRPQRPPIVRSAPILYRRDQSLCLEALIWRLIPRWSGGQFTRYSTINAKSESITDSRMYQAPWFDNQRCLIPATGVVEWQPQSTGPKQAFHIQLENTQRKSNLFCMAGIWEHSTHPSGHIERSFSILTTTPNASFAPIHDRMPVIIHPDHYLDWFDCNPTEALSFCQPYPELMQATAIGRGINNPYDNSPDVLRHLDTSLESQYERKLKDRKAEKNDESQSTSNLSLFD